MLGACFRMGSWGSVPLQCDAHQTSNCALLRHVTAASTDHGRMTSVSASANDGTEADCRPRACARPAARASTDSEYVKHPGKHLGIVSLGRSRRPNSGGFGLVATL